MVTLASAPTQLCNSWVCVSVTEPLVSVVYSQKCLIVCLKSIIETVQVMSTKRYIDCESDPCGMTETEIQRETERGEERGRDRARQGSEWMREREKERERERERERARTAQHTIFLVSCTATMKRLITQTVNLWNRASRGLVFDSDDTNCIHLQDAADSAPAPTDQG